MKMTTCWRVPAPTPLRSTGRIRGRRRGDRIGSITSVIGTFETCRHTLMMSACRGRPEVVGGRRNRRECRVGPGNFTPSLSQIRT
jgi:hypothetical protein